MDKFISISVGQGDAFYLEREGKKILIDGGKSRRGFAGQFERTVSAQSVDVLVCTHADADHINGLLGFFEAGLTAREVWLPGSWTSRLSELLSAPEEFFLETLSQIESLGDIEASNLEELENDYYKSEAERNIVVNSEQLQTAFEDISDAIEKASGFTSFHKILRPIDWLRYWHFPLNINNYSLFMDAVDTAEKIRELAILSYHSGAKIRWFEFDEKRNPSGGEKYLYPVNSREIFQVSKHRDALVYLAISKANRESLVFYSPASNDSCDVLFSADSDFSFCHKLPNIGGNCIITTPHHGSEHNKNAYNELINQNLLTRQSIFVRSDGRFRSRPGKSYKSLGAKKACTLCQHPDTERQDIIFVSSQSGWRRRKGIAWCHCV